MHKLCRCRRMVSVRLASVTFVYHVETVKDSCCGMQYFFKLSNGTIFNDLEWPLTQISRSRHYLALNISETVRDRDISYNGMDLHMPHTQSCNFE